jgi:hypothetical protein
MARILAFKHEKECGSSPLEDTRNRLREVCDRASAPEIARDGSDSWEMLVNGN